MDKIIIHKAKCEHFRKRAGEISYIVIHSSIYDLEKNLKIFNENGVSAHYFIGRDGNITELVESKNVAFHAGRSAWENITDSLNENSIGIELQAPNLGQKRSDFSKKQLDSLCFLLEKLVNDFDIPRCNIVGHSDIAVTRKPDPGMCFPWKMLYNKGFGVWYDLRKSDNEEDEAVLLKRIGYDTSNIEAARYAFCRHFIKEEVFFEEDVMKLLDNPYCKNFEVVDKKRYNKVLRAVSWMFSYYRNKS